MVKNLFANARDVRDVGLILCWEDPQEKEMATHSSTLASKISWTEKPSRLYNPWDHKLLDMTEQLHNFTSGT